MPSAANYDACPACGGRRWTGRSLPVCDRCERTVLDAAWRDMRQRLERDNASVAVLAPFDQALVADCRESLASQNSPRPYRRRR